MQVAAGLRELADLLRKQCTFDIAEFHARQSCTTFQHLQGPASANAVQSQCLIMSILRDAGKYALPSDYHARALIRWSILAPCLESSRAVTPAGMQMLKR